MLNINCHCESQHQVSVAAAVPLRPLLVFGARFEDVVPILVD